MISVVNLVTQRLGRHADVNQPTPTFDGPGAAALSKLSGQVLGFSLLAVVLFIIVGAILIGVGKYFNDGRAFKAGIVGVGCGVLAGVIAMNAAGLLNWGGDIGLF